MAKFIIPLWLALFSVLLISCGGSTGVSEDPNDSQGLDTQPDPYSLDEQSGVALSSWIESNTISISGVDTATNISISGGEYAVNNGAYSSVSGQVESGDNIRVRQMSSSDYLTSTHAQLNIGGVTDQFTVTTISQPSVSDTSPDPFSFVDITDAALSSEISSNPVLVSGINTAVSISISNGKYSVNGSDYLTTDGTVYEGDSVSIKVTSADDYSKTTEATLNISGVTDSFSVTTIDLPVVPADFVLQPMGEGDPSFTSEHFSGSQNCALCHDGLTDNTGADVSIITDWSSSMMANSARDPFWRAKLSSELKRTPALAEVLNDECTRCHAPMANEEMHRKGEVIEVLNSGLLDTGHSRHDALMEGVSCTLCHQLADAEELGTLEGFSGKYKINENRQMFGPYDNIRTQPMLNQTGYTPIYSAHIKDSEICASCHNLKTPSVDEYGNVISQGLEDQFPEQMPYSEWLHSDYANQQSCQDCHMSRSDGVIMSTRPAVLSTLRDNFAEHDFIGGNLLMLDILANNRNQLGVLANSFTDTQARTKAMLEGAASIEQLQSSLRNGQLDFTLRINSNTGHKLPSSYPSRRVIVHVTVTDSNGNKVFESGHINYDGSVLGVDSDNDELSYEAHHNVITSEQQVQVYEAIMGDNHGEVNYTLLRGRNYLKDNRILPSGFDKQTASKDIQVIGAALSDDDFTAGSDSLRYQISDLGNGPFTVSAELVYQVISYPFARDLFRDNTPETNDFHVMYDRSGFKSVVMTSSRFDVN